MDKKPSCLPTLPFPLYSSPKLQEGPLHPSKKYQPTGEVGGIERKLEINLEITK